MNYCHLFRISVHKYYLQKKKYMKNIIDQKYEIISPSHLHAEKP